MFLPWEINTLTKWYIEMDMNSSNIMLIYFISMYIYLQVAYIDVCDDHDYARCLKGLHEKAKNANVSAITTAGIYPGISNGYYLI